MRKSRGPSTSLLVAILLASLSAACGTPAATLSDAALVWCLDTSHYVALRDTASVLGISETTLIQVEYFHKGTMGASDKQTADYGRACTPAFEGRQ